MNALQQASTPGQARPLDGVRVLELGQLLAGPFAASVLAYFGADVIKVEPPGRGDPLRQWRVLRDGTSLWWHSLARNKRCITLDLKAEAGRDLARRLAAESDVLIENFRPGTLESWNLGPADMAQINPGLVFARISGYGQTGPYAQRPGFASVCEGFGGFRYVNGHPGETPVRPNLSIGDTLSGMQAVIGILLSLLHKGKTAQGQVVDVAIFESVFNLLEGVVPEFDGAGVVREPSGTTVTGIVPTNTYRCRDGRFVVIGGNGDSIFRRLMTAAGRADLAADPRLSDNRGRVEHEAEIDRAIAHWTSGLDAAAVLDCLERARVPAGPIYNVADMMKDPHYQARGLFESVEVDGRELKIPALPPFLSATPGRTQWPGPALGAHNQAVYGTLLGLHDEQIQALQSAGII